MIKIIQPYHFLIEKTAGQMAAVFYDAARSSGLKIINLQGEKINLVSLKTPRNFARKYLEKFIPAAVYSLIEIMSRETTPENQKEQIYLAIMERTNDNQLSEMGKIAGLKEFEQTVLYKPDDVKPLPIIINKEKING